MQSENQEQVKFELVEASRGNRVEQSSPKWDKQEYETELTKVTSRKKSTTIRVGRKSFTFNPP